MARYYYYFDRTGKRIEADLWKQFQEDPEYRVLRTFDNESMYAALVWNGRINHQEFTGYSDYHPIFQLVVKNYREDGSKVPDLKFDGKSYRYEHDAIKGYEDMLVEITDAIRKDDGTLDEVGNVLLPPPPPDPDAPSDTFIEGLSDDVGAW